MSNLKVDAAIAEKVMEWPHIGENDPYRWFIEQGGVIVKGVPQKFPAFGGIPNNWSPATDVAAAFDVVAAMQQRGWEIIIQNGCAGEAGKGWFVLFGLKNRDDKRWINETTLPLAICRAALRVVGCDFDGPEDGRWPVDAFGRRTDLPPPLSAGQREGEQPHA